MIFIEDFTQKCVVPKFFENPINLQTQTCPASVFNIVSTGTLRIQPLVFKISCDQS